MDDDGNDISDMGVEKGGPAGRGPRPRGTVTGGWGFEGADDSGLGVGGSRLSVDPPSPQGRNKKSHFDDDDDIQPIPDLDEEAEEDITRQVAAPPRPGTSGAVLSQPVRSVRELDWRSAAVHRSCQPVLKKVLTWRHSFSASALNARSLRLTSLGNPS